MSVALLAPVSATASTVTVFDPDSRRGGPIAQTFLESQGGNVSLVRTENRISCVASQVLPIADASYSASDGTPVSFDDVIRSPASSIQAIAHPGEPIAFRIQLKYSPDPSKPVEMQIDGQTIDLITDLEPSGDSLLVTGDAAQLLADALRRGTIPTLHATSDVTERQVVDRIMAPDMAGLDSCLAALEDLPAVGDLPDAEIPDYDVADADIHGSDMEWWEADDRVVETLNVSAPESFDTIATDEIEPYRPIVPVPVTGLRLEFTARPDPETRVDPSALKHCRMRDIPDEVFLGRLKAVTGFFSQTQDIYVAFDERGELQRAYIPGIFDSDLTMGTNTAHISLAADTNLPDEPNTVRGCLGDAPLEAPVCTISTSGGDDYTVAECGVLGMSQKREDFPDDLFVPFFNGVSNVMSTMTTGRDNRVGGISISKSVPSTPDFGTFSGLLGGSGGVGETRLRDSEFSPSIPDGGDRPIGEGSGDSVSVVPLPAALWMMLLALTGLYFASMSQQRKKRR